MNLKCLKCGSDKMMSGVGVLDQGQYSDGQLKVRVAEEPQAIFFKHHKWTPLTANICGECGYTELFANNPRGLYESYLKSIEPK